MTNLLTLSTDLEATFGFNEIDEYDTYFDADGGEVVFGEGRLPDGFHYTTLSTRRYDSGLGTPTVYDGDDTADDDLWLHRTAPMSDQLIARPVADRMAAELDGLTAVQGAAMVRHALAQMDAQGVLRVADQKRIVKVAKAAATRLLDDAATGDGALTVKAARRAVRGIADAAGVEAPNLAKAINGLLDQNVRRPGAIGSCPTTPTSRRRPRRR